ncbi:hypothetical protein NPIL_195711, partial [Nephila pilipes]
PRESGGESGADLMWCVGDQFSGFKRALIYSDLPSVFLEEGWVAIQNLADMSPSFYLSIQDAEARLIGIYGFWG